MTFNRHDIWQGRSFETYGEYSEAEVELFRRLVNPGNTVVEVGANMGSHTVPLSRLVGDKGAVIALEPERHSYYILCANVAINNLRNVFPFQQAMGDASGSINVPELAQDVALNIGGTELERDWSQVSHYPVALNRLDALNLSALHFLKVDVEGMEERVLRGGEQTIRKHKPVLYVESDRPDKDADLRAYIRSLGYKILNHRPPFWNSANFFENPVNVFGDVVSLNLLCHPADQKFDPGEGLGLAEEV
jgi:FkbM family methyltransferase